MDEAVVQQLTQLLQQMLSVLQGQGGAGGMDPGAADVDGTGDAMEGMDDPNAMGDMGAMGDDPTAGGDDPTAPAMEDGTLHDRINQLETHTGLKKAAGATLLTRVDALEDAVLGQQWEGPLVDRIEQLSQAIGLQKTAKQPPAKQPDAKKEPPDEIAIEDLIKSAVREAIIVDRQTRQAPAATDYPSLETLRKTPAQQVQVVERGAPRRSQTVIQTDDELMKAAAELGWTEADLDQEIGIGDVLLMQYNAEQSGDSLFPDEDGD